jgi:hypothetical protein
MQRSLPTPAADRHERQIDAGGVRASGDRTYALVADDSVELSCALRRFNASRRLGARASSGEIATVPVRLGRRRVVLSDSRERSDHEQDLDALAAGAKQPPSRRDRCTRDPAACRGSRRQAVIVAASPALLPARASRARRRLPCNARGKQDPLCWSTMSATSRPVVQNLTSFRTAPSERRGTLPGVLFQARRAERRR